MNREHVCFVWLKSYLIHRDEQQFCFRELALQLCKNTNYKRQNLNS